MQSPDSEGGVCEASHIPGTTQEVTGWQKMTFVVDWWFSLLDMSAGRPEGPSSLHGAEHRTSQLGAGQRGGAVTTGGSFACPGAAVGLGEKSEGGDMCPHSHGAHARSFFRSFKK